MPFLRGTRYPLMVKAGLGIEVPAAGYVFYNFKMDLNQAYDLHTNTFESRAGMLNPRIAFASGTVGTKIYAFGGPGPIWANNRWEQGEKTNDEYNTETDTWTSKAGMVVHRKDPGGAATGGKVYAMAGQSGPTFTKSIEEYDPGSNRWTKKADMTHARAILPGAASVNGNVYVVGGSANKYKCEAYNPVTNTWSEKADLNTGRYNFGLVGTSDGRLYAISGRSTPTVEMYTVSTNTWEYKTPMPATRDGNRAVFAEKFIYVLSGYMERYDIETDTWIDLGRPLYGMADHGFGLVEPSA